MTAKAGRDTHTHRDGKLYISKVGRMRVCSTENSLYRKTGERVKFRLISPEMRIVSLLFYVFVYAIFIAERLCLHFIVVCSLNWFSA